MAESPHSSKSGAHSEHLCLDCGAGRVSRGRCIPCGSPRTVSHPELTQLSIAHLDCDAFYASVEKGDNPSLADKPVIVGGGRRGVVSAACYVARTYGVRSAMPMFKALKACPHAVVVRPDMAKYRTVSRVLRDMMSALTPAVEPLSIDEAFLDLSGTEALHGAPPAILLQRLQSRIERDVGVTASIGLSHNKFLAKMASDLKKPRGFAIIGRAETLAFLAERPVTDIWGVGQRLANALADDGIYRIGQLQHMSEETLMRRYASMGKQLFALSRGLDERSVTPDRQAKSVSSETTLEQDLTHLDDLAPILWQQCERLSAALKQKNRAGRTVVLKLKRADHRLRTRSYTLDGATQLAHRLYEAAHPLLARECDGQTSFRLIGVGASDLTDPAEADAPDLIDPSREKRSTVERTMDDLRAKFGTDAIALGRGLSSPTGRRPKSGDQS